MRHSDKSPEDVTIIDVARAAGVSSATVSRVINDKDNVSAGTRDNVLATMTRLGYVVNLQARSLAGGRANVIGLLVQDLGTSYIGEILRGIDDELLNTYYDLMLYTTHQRKTNEAAHVSSLTRGLSDGLLLILPVNADSYLEMLRWRQFPFVMIDQAQSLLGPSICATNQQGAAEAMHYLLDLGHKRIGFISGDLKTAPARDRLRGYCDSLQDYDIPFDQDLVREGNFQQPLGYSHTLELLRLPEPPTAIFASNDISAFGVMDAIRELGLRIPDDVSVIGFDDLPQAAHVHPALTTVRQPLEEMGRLAVRMLLKHIEYPRSNYEHISLPTNLVVRASCAPPR